MKQKVVALFITLLVINVFTVACSKSPHATVQETLLPSEVWIDDDFNESTPGWGLTHFQKIQDGINAVVEGGTVHVSSGTYCENVIVNRTIILIGENKSSTIIDGNYTRNIVVSITTDTVSIEGFTIQNCIYLGQERGGINIDSSFNNVSGVNFRENWIDISIYGMHNKIDSCVFNSSFLNIEIWSNSNSIISNQFSYCYRAISFQASFDNTVENNSILHAYTGILMQESYENRIKNNAISNCLTSTITIGSNSRRNLIVANTLSSSEQGITIDFGSSNNTFFHNTFMNNGVQVSSNLAENTWDNGYPSGGNYWSDCNGTDLYSGRYQNETGSDGIGDTSYSIDENNQDRYPLMKPWTNIAILDISPSKTVVGKGFTLHIYVSVQNQGWNTETLNITAYANATTITTLMNIAITGRNSSTLTLIWNTTGFAKGNYTIWAYAWPVPGEKEIDTADNNCTDGWIVVTWQGDLTDENHLTPPGGVPDMKVDENDLWYFCAAFIDYYKIHVKDANCDFDNNCKIDEDDLWTFCGAFIDYWKAH